MSRPRLLADHDLNEQIITGVSRREPAVSFSTLRALGLQSSADREVLEFAASEALVVISHDANTMTAAANARIVARLPMSGLVIAPQRARIGMVIEDLILIWAATDADEWPDRIEFLPL